MNTKCNFFHKKRSRKSRIIWSNVMALIITLPFVTEIIVDAVLIALGSRSEIGLLLSMFSLVNLIMIYEYFSWMMEKYYYHPIKTHWFNDVNVTQSTKDAMYRVIRRLFIKGISKKIILTYIIINCITIYLLFLSYTVFM